MDQSEQNKIRASNIRAVWDALLAPRWTRDDLIDLGKAIFARKALKDLDPKRFDALLPRLVEIVERLEARFTPGTPADAAATPEKEPGAGGAAGPTGCPTRATGPVGPSRCTTGPSGLSTTCHPHTSHAPDSESKEDPAIDATASRKE